VDIGGHPPFPAGSKQLSSNFDNLLFLAVFRVLEEVVIMLNDFHTGACGGHLSGLATTQNILRAGYFCRH
jgi:hypothetical protein